MADNFLRDSARVVAVTDADDERLRLFTQLTDVDLRKSREAEWGIYMAEGRKVIERALEAGHRPHSVLTTQRWVAGLVGLLPPNVPIFVGTLGLLEEITGYRVHRGALAAFARPPSPDLLPWVAAKRRLLLLENLKEHTNVGAVIRSAAAMNFDGVVSSPDSADPLYRRAVKVSMGTVFTVPSATSRDWDTDLRLMKSQGLALAALTTNTTATPLDVLARNPPERLGLLLGTEGTGLRPSTIDACDVEVTIPMAPGVDSLNVGAAAAVACYALQPSPHMNIAQQSGARGADAGHG